MQKSLAQVTLDEIFHYETRVYINPSAKKSGYSRDYNGLGNHLIEGQYIDFLDPNKLLYTYKEELNHNKLLRFNNASTIYPATTEIRRFNRILTAYIAKNGNTYSYRGNENKKLIEDIIEVLANNIKLSKRKEIRSNSFEFKTLHEIVKFISMDLELKRDSGIKYGYKGGRQKPLDTDEKYVTRCLFDALNENRSSLFSGDFDFVALFDVVPRILGLEYFKPFNDNFRRSLHDNFPNIFLIDNFGSINLIDFEYVKDFSTPNNISDNLIEKIKKFWEQKGHLFNLTQNPNQKTLNYSSNN